MSRHETHGIQQLLVAEKRAAEKVAEARKRKVKRIKQARDEAQAEIEAYRRERERQFREYEARHMGSKEDVAAKIDKDTESIMRNMEKLVQDNKDKVTITRLKQAKEEAATEVEKYRQQRENALEVHKLQVLGSCHDVESHIDRQTTVTINKIDIMVEENKQKVIDDLFDLVMDVKAAPNPNFFLMSKLHKI